MGISFFAPCVPPKTTAQQKGAMAMPGGGVRMFTKAKVRAAENDLMGILLPHQPEEPVAGHVSVRIALTWPWLKGDSKKVQAQGRIFHGSKPDVDNSVKSIIDALVKLRFIEDDSRVVMLSASKHRGDRPGIRIEIEAVGNE